MGIFYAADPLISTPQDIRDLNRYQYALGNPYKFTDPTGFMEESPHDPVYQFLVGAGLIVDVYQESLPLVTIDLDEVEIFYEASTTNGQVAGNREEAANAGLPDLPPLVPQRPSNGRVEHVSLLSIPIMFLEIGIAGALESAGVNSDAAIIMASATVIVASTARGSGAGVKRGVQQIGKVLGKKAQKSSTTSLVTKYPGNPSIAGTSERVFLRPGMVIDRYGSLSGKWFSPAGTSFGARSIPPGQSPLMRFKVLKPFEVNSSVASPGAFRLQTGFGRQFESPVGADVLIRRGIITPY